MIPVQSMSNRPMILWPPQWEKQTQKTNSKENSLYKSDWEMNRKKRGRNNSNMHNNFFIFLFNLCKKKKEKSIIWQPLLLLLNNGFQIGFIFFCVAFLPIHSLLHYLFVFSFYFGGNHCLRGHAPFSLHVQFFIVHFIPLSSVFFP